jgi:hypothetical protein
MYFKIMPDTHRHPRISAAHHRPLYLACPDVLSLVELLSGDVWGSLAIFFYNY